MTFDEWWDSHGVSIVHDPRSSARDAAAEAFIAGKETGRAAGIAAGLEKAEEIALSERLFFPPFDTARHAIKTVASAIATERERAAKDGR